MWLSLKDLGHVAVAGSPLFFPSPPYSPTPSNSSEGSVQVESCQASSVGAPSQARPGLSGQNPETGLFIMKSLYRVAGTWILPYSIQLLLPNLNMSKMKEKL